MFLTRWEPWTKSSWNAINQLHNEVDRLFQRWDGVRYDASVFPPVNVFEEENGYVLEAALPGLDLADLDITVTGPNQLKLKGERKAPVPEKATPHRQERTFGPFVRTVTFPAPIDADRVEAKFDNGILQVTLPKHEQAKPRKINVRS
jgi:HSP20 family protein